MTGKDGASYGYWLGSKKPWKQKIEDGFSFPGGVERKVQGAVWEKGSGKNKKCLGIISLHFSYQNSEVRQKESAWVLDWLKSKEKLCKQWLVLGDFNADENSAEMKLLFEAGLKSLAKELKPTVGAFNPIRQIYGKNIPSKTIDWALGWNVQQATAETVFDKPVQDLWLSDHAGLAIVVNDF